MKSRTEWLSEMQQNFSDFIAKTPAADLEKNARAFITQAFSNLDLLTRDEFDTQSALLERALLRLAALEKRVEQLEQRLQNTEAQRIEDDRP